MKKVATSNDEIADTLDHVADLLKLEGESGFRVRSYRNAAQTIRDLDTPVRTLMKQDGEHLLKDLPGIGDKLAGSIKEIATTGRQTCDPRPGAGMSRALRPMIRG